jgi:SAM-dependent methyltransferase
VESILVNDGSVFELDPRVRSAHTPTCLVLRQGERTVLISLLRDGSLHLDNAKELENQGYGTMGARKIFEHPELMEALFNWSPEPELNFFEEQFGSLLKGRGLDVGCGNGRILLPCVLQRGWCVDGIDESLSSTRWVQSKLPSSNGCRIFRARVEYFCSPNSYSYAFACMNSIRYLTSMHQLRAHLGSLGNSVIPGGAYLFHLDLRPDPATPYRSSWDFAWEGRPHRATWLLHSFDHLSSQIIEEVVIEDVERQVEVTREYQRQGYFPIATLLSLFRDGCPWKLEATFDDRFERASVDREARGNFWFLLRRVS